MLYFSYTYHFLAVYILLITYKHTIFIYVYFVTLVLTISYLLYTTLLYPIYVYICVKIALLLPV